MCLINNCLNQSITSDGFCEKHKNFTVTDYDVINNYIKNTIEKINPINTRTKLNSFIRLNRYLMYRVEFIKSKNLLDSMILKLELLYNKMLTTVLWDEEIDEKLINLHIDLCYLQDS